MGNEPYSLTVQTQASKTLTPVKSLKITKFCIRHLKKDPPGAFGKSRSLLLCL